LSTLRRAGTPTPPSPARSTDSGEHASRKGKRQRRSSVTRPLGSIERRSRVTSRARRRLCRLWLCLSRRRRGLEVSGRR
jgi:hypothetical protein